MKDKKNIMGVLRIMDDYNIKPNYSELSRFLEVDRHTLKKYHDNGKIPDRKKVIKKSKYDIYYDEILELTNIAGVTKKGVFQALKYKYGESIGNYNGFKAYTLRKNIVCKKLDTTPHLLYETEPGEQIQCDWKENLVTHNKDGTAYEYNVFSATLGYSREHVYIYSVGKTEDDFMRCVIETFKKLGGKTKILKTDNMSAIVTIQNGKRMIHKRITSFFKDLDVKLELCKVKSPETKGKTESSNRFANWLKAFDYQIKNEEELIHIIEGYITSEANKQINTRTRVPPALLFKKEVNCLRPIGNEANLETYIQCRKKTRVPNTQLITYQSKQYSVPHKYIGQYVDVVLSGNEIYIYHNHNLITAHTISNNSINYKKDHYTEGLAKRLKSDVDEIEELAKKNLERLNRLGGD